MKRALIIAGMLLSFGSFYSEVFACNCAPVIPTTQHRADINAERKRYYLNEFKGYLFTGRVIDIWTYPTVKVVKVEVEKYWLKATPKNLVVLTSAKESDCGVDFKLKKTYVFKPQHRSHGLTSSLCDYLGNGDAEPNSETARELIEVLGEPVNWGCSPRFPNLCPKNPSIDQ